MKPRGIPVWLPGAVIILALVLACLLCVWLVWPDPKPTPTPTVIVTTEVVPTFTPTKTKWPTVTPFIPTATFTRRPTATPITPTATITRHPTATKTPTATPKKLYWNWCLQMVVDYPPYRYDKCNIKD